MSSTTLSVPVLLTFAGNIAAKMCAQAATATQGAQVNLQPIDYSANTALQQWQFGSDNRIYLFNPSSPSQPSSLCLGLSASPTNGVRLILVPPNPNDQTQQWVWINNFNLKNQGALPGFTYVIDDTNGGVNPGNPLQIWAPSNTNQNWIVQLLLGSNYATMPSQAVAA